MAGDKLTSKSVSLNQVTFNGGLNTAAGPFGVAENETSDLLNVDLDIFGSVVQRNGYTALNTVPINISNAAITVFAASGSSTTVTSNSHGLSNSDRVVITGTTSYNGAYTISGVATNTFVITATFVADDATGTWYEVPESDGLHEFVYTSGSSTTRTLINIADAKIYTMDGLDGTWDDSTDAVSLTAENYTDFSNFLNECYMTNGVNAPWKTNTSLDSAAMTVPAGLTTAKYNEEYSNYLFLGNVTVSGTTHKSRIYWCNIKDTGTWTATDFIDIAKDDGQEITGLKALGNRLVIFKERSIYVLFFTGDADIPFILPDGGRTNSTVGCVAPFSIQEVSNGILFLAQDGLYLFDGINSYKTSDKISPTIQGLNPTRLNQARSINYGKKNMYMMSVPSSSSSTNDTIITWDYLLQAFSLYSGVLASSMTILYASGVDERPYFGDYGGFVYRMDIGDDDYPANVKTAISSYYWTNWKPTGDLVNQKVTNEVVLYHTIENSTMSFSWAYDFSASEDYTISFSMSTSIDVYGGGVYGEATYAKTGGNPKRLSLKGRGRVVRYKFGNSNATETWRVDGLGLLTYLSTRSG